MIRDQFLLDLARELIVDNFAGGGGTSCAQTRSQSEREQRRPR